MYSGPTNLHPLGVWTRHRLEVWRPASATSSFLIYPWDPGVSPKSVSRVSGADAPDPCALGAGRPVTGVAGAVDSFSRASSLAKNAGALLSAHNCFLRCAYATYLVANFLLHAGHLSVVVMTAIGGLYPWAL